MEQTSLASTLVENSTLTDEAKAGVVSAINGLQKAFSLKHGNDNWRAHLKDIVTAISSILILLEAVGLGNDKPLPSEVGGLIKEVETMIVSFQDIDLDPSVRDIGQRHLAILSTLLQHIPIFGVEAALTTYFELVMKLRRADIGSSEEANKKVKPLFAKIKGWGEVLTSIDKAWNSGSRLLNKAGKARDLLDYIPDISP